MIEPLCPAALIDKWRENADCLEQFGAANQAAAIRRCASELEQSLQNYDEEQLTLAEAARESGVSYDHLRHQIAAGIIPNAGRPHAPRVRRRDLPRRARSTTSRYNPEEDVARLLAGPR